MKTFPCCACLRALLCLFIASIASAAAADDGWISLFDGRSLAGWQVAENPGSIRVNDGVIVCHGERAHAFYTGPDGGQPDFENFEFSAEVLAKPGANSGVFFHTAWQEKSWPAQGFEVQVNNSAKQHGNYLELKKTGSLYGIRNVYKQLVPDDTWFTLSLTVRKPRVEIRVNGALVVDYVEPLDPLPASAPKLNRLGRGTFALQGHDPDSIVHYRNLRVRPLAPGTDESVSRPTFGELEGRLLGLARDNFPLADLHVHLKNGLTLEQALRRSRAVGISLGVVTTEPEAASALRESAKGEPVFVGLLLSEREGAKRITRESQAKFDYVLAATPPPRSSDPEAFIEELVVATVTLIESEPIDILARPTLLPASLAARHDELWTEARMQRVIAAAVKHGVAFEVSSQDKLPSEKFARLAKAAGAKFTIGGNNDGPDDFGKWGYALQLQKAVGLAWRDMFVPGHKPSRAQR